MPSTGSEHLLEVSGLVKAFDGRRVVDGVGFHVDQGEIVGLLGPNGAGKTTSFRMTVGLLHPDEGQVHLNGQECSRLPMYRRARLGMGYLPQEP
ncbi:MAG: ATP-binding cassette domain-containing protein, partial [Planctomycetota bacterium]|nr:ATP-binding cassette domain-containing protein [Planctomycetota bacterium]